MDDSSGAVAEPKPKPDRTLLVILGVIAALVIISLAVVFSRGEPALRDASTPEGVVQRYTAALIDGDTDAAQSYLTANALTNCPDQGGSSAPLEDTRVTLVSSDVHGKYATVRVAISQFSAGGPFDSSDYSTEEVFTLSPSGGSWLIDSFPWPLDPCYYN